MAGQTLEGSGEELRLLAEQAPDTKLAPAHGIAAIALSMALKYHDINTVQDGTLYQQYKLEGRNMRELQLDSVFETALRIEMHLLGAADRIASVVMDALAIAVDEVEEAAGGTAEPELASTERPEGTPKSSDPNDPVAAE